MIAVVLKGYPRLSETFIAQELRALEEAGLDLRIYSLRHPTDDHSHPIHSEIVALVTYLPEYLHDEPWRVILCPFPIEPKRRRRRPRSRALRSFFFLVGKMRKGKKSAPKTVFLQGILHYCIE